MKYIRLFSDEDGESHIEYVDIDFKSVDYAPPAPPLDIADLSAATNCSIIKAHPGWVGDWHPSPFRQIHFYLQGEVECEVSDRQTAKVGPGSIVLVEDTSGKGHRSWVVGDTEVVIAVVKLD